MSEQEAPLSATMVVLSMVNGMIGGLILILPLMAITSGYLLAIIIIGITGFFSYYSCRLCIKHIKNEPDLDTAILHHFNNNKKIKAFYDICVWSSLIFIDFLYFQLITLQWHGLLGQSTNKTLNAIFNAVALIAIVFLMKYYQFGASLMAYGIISIIAYVLFLTWAALDEDKSGTPERPFAAFGSDAQDLAAAMGQAFAIQSFFIPVLKKNNRPDRYGKYVLIAYILGSLGYFFIAFMGSYSILYRPFLDEADTQKTIEGYFGYGNWEVHIIEVIYLVHLYSVFPEFLLISKKRIFQVVKLPQTQTRHVNIQEIIYICGSVVVCFLIKVANVPLKDIIDFNGAVIGFFFIYFIPAVLHLKCLYFSKGKVPTEAKPVTQACKYQEMMEEGDKDINFEQRQDSGGSDKRSPNEENPSNEEEMKDVHTGHRLQKQDQKEDTSCIFSDSSHFQCDCDQKAQSLPGKALTLALIIIMVALGLFIMINGVIELGEEAAGTTSQEP